MKALSLTQPWATLVTREAKRWETRSWRTHYRGPLAIHAARGFPNRARDLCQVEPFLSELRGAEPLPQGAIVAIVEVRDVMKTEAALTRFVIEGTPEESFGDFSFGRWAWQLGILWTLAKPIPWSGSQGLWDVPDEVLQHFGWPEAVPAMPAT